MNENENIGTVETGGFFNNKSNDSQNREESSELLHHTHADTNYQVLPIPGIFLPSNTGVASTIRFVDLNFTGSNLTSIVTRLHSDLQNLTVGDDHTQYFKLLGRAGGQIGYGGTSAGENLTFSSTIHATKSKIFFGANSAYDELNTRWGIGLTSPTANLEVSSAGNTRVRIVSTVAAQTPQLVIINTSGVSGAASIYLRPGGSGDSYVAGSNTSFLYLGTAAAEGGAITANLALNGSTRDMTLVLGHFYFGTNNVRDIGVAVPTGTTNNPRTIYAATSMLAPLFNAATGFQVAGAATSGNYLRGNGTNFVSSTIQAGDIAAISPVTSVFGRTGAVVALTNDYTWAQINKATSSLADITTRVHSALQSIGANDHHNQIHAIGGADHTGSLLFTALDFTSSNLTSITTRDHSSLQGNASGDEHTQYALLAGRSGGQILIGGTGSGDDLTLQSTSHSTKDRIFFGSIGAINESTTRFGFGTTSPTSFIHFLGVQPASVGTLFGTNADGITVVSGTGGNTTVSGTGLGGNGGDISITSGVSGTAINAGTFSTTGQGGTFLLAGGNSGNNVASGSTVTSGLGGSMSLRAGDSGSVSNSSGLSAPGSGGVFSLMSGIGGNAIGIGTNNTAGSGGQFNMTAAVGGNASGFGSGTNTGGNGGLYLIASGAGGNATNGGTANNGGNGGNLTITAGTRGTGATANGTYGSITFVQATTNAIVISGANNQTTINGPTIHNNTIRLKGYTVATLPAGVQGDLSFVTDALAPAYHVAVVGGGAVVVPVFYNGAAWIVN